MKMFWLNRWSTAFGFLATVALLVLCTQVSEARLAIPEGAEDLQWLGASAAFVFHARVISFDTTINDGSEEGFAILKVDRWYKGKPQASVIRMRFRYGTGDRGSDCVDPHRTDSWLIFATKASGDIFHFSNDCEGGLPMSPILAPDSRGTWDQRLQRDLIAGLHDPDPAVRLANIARLGGLKLASSAAALHDFINSGSDDERRWAIYAALRSGDLSVLPQVEEIVINIEGQLRARKKVQLDAAPSLGGAYPDPDSDIALELEQVRDSRAVPALVRIMSSAKTDLVRSCASQALAEIADPRSAPAAAAALSDSSRYVRYDAILMLWKLTKQPACATPAGNLPDEQSAPYYERCRTWWNQNGSSMAWPPLDY